VQERVEKILDIIFFFTFEEKNLILEISLQHVSMAFRSQTRWELLQPLQNIGSRYIFQPSEGIQIHSSTLTRDSETLSSQH
jgi:hypothetical protein